MKIFLSFVALTLSVGAEVRMVRDGEALDIQGPRVTLSETRPRLDFFVGDGRAVVEWIPEGRALVTRGQTETPLGPARNIVMRWTHASGVELHWSITEWAGSRDLALQCEVVNGSGVPIRLRDAYLLDCAVGDFEFAGDAADWMTSSRYLKYAKYYDSLAELQRRGQLTRDGNPVEEKNITRDIPYEEDFCFYTEGGQSGMSISAVGDVSYVWTNLKVPTSGNVGLSVRSEMNGVLVPPGGTRKSERVLVSFKPWREAGADVVKWIRSSIPPRDTPPVFGWCSWYCSGSHVDQKQCVDLAEYVAPRRDRYPFQTLQLDDGWQIGRHCWFANDKFQMGLAPLAETFKRAGGMPGIWMTPISPNSQRVHEGRMTNDYSGEGKMVRSFDKSWYVGYRAGRPTMGNLDPSVPAVREYIRASLKALRDQGYTYFKTDFSQVARMESAYRDPTLTSFEAQRLLYSIMREAIGEESYLLACNGGPARVVLGLADATRIGTDSGTKWGFCQRPNEFGKPGNVHGAWFPILQMGASSAYTGLMACDPDVTRADHVGYANYDPRFNGHDPRDPSKPMPVKLSLDSVRTFHGFQGLFGGTMMISDQIDKPGYQVDNRLRMIEIMHPVTPDKGWNFAGGTDPLCTRFGFVAKRPWGEWISMVMWNPDHAGQRDMALEAAALAALGDRFHVWSFWDEEYLGVQQRGYVFKAMPHYTSKLLRLTPLHPRGWPTLVGLNFHLSMGSAELKNVKSRMDGIVVELVPSAGALEGRLVFHSTRPLAVRRAEGCDVIVVREGASYVALVTNRDRGTRQFIDLVITAKEPPLMGALDDERVVLSSSRFELYRSEK